MAERISNPSLKTTSFISEAMEMKGTLKLQGGIRIDGKFTGTIDSESSVFLGETAMVQGEINSYALVSSGRFRGNAICQESVELNFPGSMTGEITTRHLVMEKEVFFQGRCQLLMDPITEMPEAPVLPSPRKVIPGRKG